MTGKSGRRTAGHIRRLPSGRYQASYLGPDGRRYTARTASGRALTFDTKQLADGYLSRVNADIQAGRWVSPDTPAAAAEDVAPVSPPLASYSAAWLATRVRTDGRPLSPSTKLLYRNTLNRQVLPVLGELPLNAITPVMVREWYAALDTGPRQRAAAYSLLRTILNTAVADDMIIASPCRVRGAGNAKRVKKIKPATLAELEVIVEAMPQRYRAMVLLAAWCALRFGELAELRRADFDVSAAVVRVRRGVIRGDQGRTVKDPKSDAGKRDVNIPPHLVPMIKDHLRDHVAASQTALVFPAAGGGHMAPSSLYAVYFPARAKAGRDDLAFHDLRHTGATLAAATGATLAELMARLGHSTVSAAMRYQHAAAERDKAIAAALSDLAGGTVTPSGDARSARKRQAGS
jgi:integrase